MQSYRFSLSRQSKVARAPGIAVAALLVIAAVLGSPAPALAQGVARAATAASAATEPVRVNINEADVETLARSLNGVGPGKAEAIVRYREAFGEFVSVDELAEVKGIGTATVERNRDIITLD